MNSMKVKLGLENLEAREQMSAGGIHPVALPGNVATVSTMALENADNIVSLNAASPGVTRVPPTPRDLTLMNRMANRKWQLRTDVVNPYTGGTMQITAEVVFVANGTFTLNQVGQTMGVFGPVNYYSSSSGRWWVQNNGILVMHNVNPYPANYWPEWQFMHIQAVNRLEIVSPDGGTWYHIPLNSTGIPG